MPGLGEADFLMCVAAAFPTFASQPAFIGAVRPSAQKLLTGSRGLFLFDGLFLWIGWR